MFQYLSAYRANRTYRNAKRLLDYLEKHPLAVCVATADDFAAIKSAHDVVDTMSPLLAKVTF